MLTPGCDDPAPAEVMGDVVPPRDDAAAGTVGVDVIVGGLFTLPRGEAHGVPGRGGCPSPIARDAHDERTNAETRFDSNAQPLSKRARPTLNWNLTAALFYFVPRLRRRNSDSRLLFSQIPF